MGILDKQWSEKLQLDVDLTLEKAIIHMHASQKETIRKQQTVVRTDSVTRLIISRVSKEGLINTEVPLMIKERNL